MTDSAPQPTLAPWHILIIDDSPDDRAEMRQMLLRASERRCCFSEAELGEAGLRAYRAMAAHPPDCILLDYNLPDMNAQQVLAELCADADLPACPVVVVTGADALPGQTLLRAGAQDFIGKSWTTAPALLRAVENAIERFALLAEAKRTQQKLQESEHRYRLLFDKNPDGVFVVDAAGRFLLANRACETISGYPLAELLQKTFMELCAPDQLARTAEQFQQSLGKPGYSELETSFIRKDGTRVEVWVAGDLMVSGEVAALHCTVKDITDRKRAEEAVKRRLEEIGLLINNLPGFAFFKDANLRYVLLNDRACKLLGRPLEDIVGKDDFELFPARYAEKYSVDDRLVLESGEPLLIENEENEEDGQPLILSTRKVPIKDSGGKVTGLIGLSIDITERKRTETALIESEQRLRMAKAAAQLGIHEYRPVTGELIWDDRMRQLWGLGPQDPVTYEVFMSHLHPEDRAATQAAVDRALDPGGNGHYYAEYRLVHPDRILWVAATGHVTSEAGRVVRLVGTVQDITERKAFQAELERLVAERTAKLQQALDEMEHFSYAIIHDMRAPLRAMQGFLEIAEQECAGCERTLSLDYFRRVKTAAGRMDQLITDSLNFSHVVREEIRLLPIELDQLLRGIVETYPNLQPDQADIQLEGNFPPVLGNEAALTQCFSNLLGNAVKFAKPGTKPRVRIWAEQVRSAECGVRNEEKPPAPARVGVDSALRNPNSAWVRVWVEDYGIGIRKGFQSRIFDMFQRATNEQAGTGIGLAIVRKVVQRMGGAVGVESEEGQGSRFWVELLPA